jgi:hypothetical protein
MGRIDPHHLSRPGAVTIFALIILIPFAAWSPLRAARPLLALVVGIAAVVLVPNVAGTDRLRAAARDRVPAGVLVDGASTGLHGIGRAAIDRVQLARLQRLISLLDAELGPGETYLDLTSRHAQYYYLDRRPPVAVTAPYNLVAAAQQRRVVEQLAKAPPRLALLEAENIVHDGGGLALRDPLLYRYVLAHYVPMYWNGFIVGHRAEEPEQETGPVVLAVRRLPETNPRTDAAASGLVVEDPIAIKMMLVGDRVHFSGSQARAVAAVDLATTSIALAGSEPVPAGNIEALSWDVEPERVRAYRSALLERAFEIRNLESIPVAWGRSQNSLVRQMKRRQVVSGSPSALNDLSFDGDRMRVTGPDPFAIFDIGSLRASGSDAGLLRFDFRCDEQKEPPRLQVFWWGDTLSGPSESHSLHFNAASGPLIVPMDSAHRWTFMKLISGLRIDLDNPSACSSIQIKNLELYSRNGA